MLAPAADEGCADCGSVGGVRRAHAGPSAAAVAAGKGELATLKNVVISIVASPPDVC